MDFISQIWASGGTLAFTLLPFLFVLTIVVFFHELGHFAVARFFGTKIDAFSIGFGKEIYGWNDRHGTRWKICWVPLGGYVKFFGDESAASNPDLETLEKQKKKMSLSEQAACFHFKPLYQRAAIVVAGPFANFLLTIVIYTVIFTFIGQALLSPRIDQVQEGSAAAEAGLMAGDLIKSIDGRAIESFDDLHNIVVFSSDTPLNMVVERGGSELTIIATPRRTETTDLFGNTVNMGQLGLQRLRQPDEKLEVVRYNPFTAVVKSVEETWFIVDRTVLVVARLFSGKENPELISGPLRIAQMSGQVASLIGFMGLVSLVALLSVSIGLLNLLPIPMLDGGHLLFYLYEAVVGKPLNERAQEFGFRIGLTLVLCLMVFATWNDLVHLSLF